MPVVVSRGDRLVLANGSLSSLKKPSVPFSMYGGASSLTLSGGQTASFQQIYESQQWVATAVNKLTRQIAMLPLHAYRLIDLETGARERVRDHPLDTLLRKPRAGRGAMYLKQALAFPALLHGNALVAMLSKAPGAPPSSLIPLDWRFVTPRYSDESQTEVVFWETSQFGGVTRLAADRVLHMAWQGRGDIGVAPLTQISSTVGVEDSALRYQQASFNNGVRHSSVYILPPDVDLDTEEKAELRAAIRESQSGVDKAFQMALVSGGGDIKPLSHTAVEAALIDQRKLNREEIAAIYDIPPPLIGILDKATYSNISVQAKMLYGMVLGPWLSLVKETIQCQLIDAYGPWANDGLFVDFDLSDVLKGEPLAEVQAIREAIGTGIMTPNEGRQLRNLAPSPDPAAGRLHMPTNNLTAMGDAEEPAEPADPDVAKAVEHHVARVKNRAHRGNPADLDRFEAELLKDIGDAAIVAEWKQYLSRSGF